MRGRFGGLLVLALLVGCVPSMPVSGVGTMTSSVRSLPPGQTARAARVDLTFRPAVVAAQGDTMVVRSSWTVAASIDSVRVVTRAWGADDVVIYRTADGLASQHTAIFLMPLDNASAAGYVWTCVITYRGTRSGGELYGETETAASHQPRQNCSDWTPFSWDFTAPLASGVTVTVERRP